MKKIVCILMSICMVFALAACGSSSQPAADPAPETAPADIAGKPEVSEPVREIPADGDQLQVIAANAELWLNTDEYNADQTLYAVSDLDGNERYELISALTEGTGEFSTLQFWEVSADLQSLEKLEYTYGEDHSQPDIFYTSQLRCYSAADGNYLVIADYIRNGVAETYYLQDWLCLKDGKVDVDVIAHCSALEEVPFEGTEPELNFYYYSGQSDEVDLDRQGYIDAPDAYFEGAAKNVCTLFWTNVPADAAQNADAIYGLLEPSRDTFRIEPDEAVFESLAFDPESYYDSPALYPKEYLLDTWYLTHIGGEFDMQTAEEAGADSELSIIGEPDKCLAFFSYNDPTDARGAYLLTEMPVYDSDGYEAPAEGEFHVEFMDGGADGEEINRFYAEVDPDDGSLWVTWFWWAAGDEAGDPTITYLRYVKAEG